MRCVIRLRICGKKMIIATVMIRLKINRTTPPVSQAHSLNLDLLSPVLFCAVQGTYLAPGLCKQWAAVRMCLLSIIVPPHAYFPIDNDTCNSLKSGSCLYFVTQFMARFLAIPSAIYPLCSSQNPYFPSVNIARPNKR